MSSGPLVEFKVNGKIPGESVSLPTQGGTVTLEGEVWSTKPLDKVLIYRNGKIWKEIPLYPEPTRVRFRERAEVTESGWFSVTVEGRPLAASPSS